MIAAKALSNSLLVTALFGEIQTLEELHQQLVQVELIVMMKN